MKNATITTVQSNINRNGYHQVDVKASYTAASGRVISAMGWTTESALRNLSRKTGVEQFTVTIK